VPSAKSDSTLHVLLIGFVVLAIAVLGALWLTARQDEAFAKVSHTLQVQNTLAGVITQLQEAEGGQRGYLLTGRDEYLAPYRSGIAGVDRELDALDSLVADNPVQLAHAEELRRAVLAREALLSENLGDYAAGRPLRHERLAQGKTHMDEVRRAVAAMTAEEERLLADRTQAATRQTGLVTLVLSLSGLTTLLLGVFAFLDGRRRLAAAMTARDALAETNAHLEAEAASRAAAEAQVRQMQKMEAVGQLTGGIAHDFNNMLAIVLGSLDLAKRRLSGDLRRAETCIDNAIEGAQRAAQLTGRLLAFSRQQPLAPRSLDVNKLVGGMAEMLRRTIGDQLRVETVLAGGLWRAFADPGQLENAILNLCVNARDAMPEGGRLTVETSNGHLDDAYAAAHSEVQAGQYVMVSVSDTGTGMPPEVVERAFDPFYTTKGMAKGTGLGLSQVHGFVKQSGGHVKIYSEPGVGTTVKIYLPRHFGGEDAMDVEAMNALDTPRGTPEEIVLVVEDDDSVRHLSVDALRELGYTVVQAADAVQALAVLTLQPRVDLLFTDIVMPDMNGRRLAELALEARPGLKVLYTTGYTRNAIVHNGMLDPDVAFLAKPFTVDQLATKVRQVMEGRGANRPASEDA
jgi:signal transduction histidine kinase/CheY-like chemotaxis protein